MFAKQTIMLHSQPRTQIPIPKLQVACRSEDDSWPLHRRPTRFAVPGKADWDAYWTKKLANLGQADLTCRADDMTVTPACAHRPHH